MNWGPSDPEADDTPMCHHASLVLWSSALNPKSYYLFLTKLPIRGSFWVKCVYFSCYFFSRMPLSIGLIYSFPIFSQVSSLSPNLSLAFSRNQTLMNLLFNFWWVFLFFYFFVFYLWNTGLITEFSKSVLQFWSSPTPTPTPTHHP